MLRYALSGDRQEHGGGHDAQEHERQAPQNVHVAGLLFRKLPGR